MTNEIKKQNGVQILEGLLEAKKKQVEHMKECLKVQGADGNYNYSEYMLGMYNGMELMLSIMEGREPVYKMVNTENFLCKKELPIN